MNDPVQENVVIPHEALAQAEEAKDLMVKIENHSLTNQKDYEDAGLELKLISNKIRELENTRKRITQPMDLAKKQIIDFFGAPERYLSSAKSMLKINMMSWKSEQERVRRGKEAKIRKAQREEQDRILAEAEQAEKEGDKEIADAIIERVVDMPVAIVPDSTPKIKGISEKTNWYAEVEDFMSTIESIANGQAPIQAAKADMVFLNQQARSLKSAMDISGVKAKSKTTLAS